MMDPHEPAAMPLAQFSATNMRIVAKDSSEAREKRIKEEMTPELMKVLKMIQQVAENGDYLLPKNVHKIGIRHAPAVEKELQLLGYKVVQGQVSWYPEEESEKKD